MCPGDCIESIKKFWWVIFYEYIHRETNEYITLERIADIRGSNITSWEISWGWSMANDGIWIFILWVGSRILTKWSYGKLQRRKYHGRRRDSNSTWRKTCKCGNIRRGLSKWWWKRRITYWGWRMRSEIWIRNWRIRIKRE